MFLTPRFRGAPRANEWATRRHLGASPSCGEAAECHGDRRGQKRVPGDRPARGRRKAMTNTGLGAEIRELTEAMAKRQVAIRFDVSGEGGRRAASWKCWAEIGRGKNDVYVACRGLGGVIKTSLHESGDWLVDYD